MNDTSPEIQRLMHAKLMAHSNEERFLMGASMFDAARAMGLASFPSDLPPLESKRRLFQRVYGKPLWNPPLAPIDSP